MCVPSRFNKCVCYSFFIFTAIETTFFKNINIVHRFFPFLPPLEPLTPPLNSTLERNMSTRWSNARKGLGIFQAAIAMIASVNSE